ncbi:MAG: type II toxin-antitoxin system RelE/ParE family toxin [Candidatus Hydrogenedentes bacterium]|nr:type II toxin-antitoxin system RelE/ParE family toxin [Candidatus Hydrogenedentota bacterium]
MPRTQIVAYCESNGEAPVLEWLKMLHLGDRRAHAACMASIRLLAKLGYELRRPHADYVQEGLYELRTRALRVHYRIFYFYAGRQVVVLAHAISKEGKLPISEVRRALQRKDAYAQDPKIHTHKEVFQD